MAEKGSNIPDQTWGESIATRIGAAPDEFSSTRVIELLSGTSQALDSLPIIRGAVGSLISTPDDRNLQALAAASSLITVGDAFTLLVSCEHKVFNGEVRITPVLYNDAETKVEDILETKDANVSTQFRWGLNGRYPAPMLHWFISSGVKIGLHVGRIQGAGNGVLVRGAVI